MNHRGKIVFFFRKKRSSNHSIEKYFFNVVKFLPSQVDYIFIYMPFFGDNIFSKFINGIYCKLNQGSVNHITGDVTYISPFLTKSRTITTILDCTGFKYYTGFKLFIYKLIWFYFPIKYSKFITAISNNTKIEIEKFIPYSKDKIIVNYIANEKIYKPKKKEFYETKPVILQIGTSENKNIYRLIEALNNVNCKLVIIGEMNPHILEKLNNSNIDYTSLGTNLQESEVVMQYEKCDIVSFISTSEGFGMPIIEANAIGRPLVTSSISSMPEIAGDSALLVNPYSIDEIRNAFLQIIHDSELRDNLINKGFENIKRFNIESITNIYLNLYYSISNFQDFKLHKKN